MTRTINFSKPISLDETSSGYRVDESIKYPNHDQSSLFSKAVSSIWEENILQSLEKNEQTRMYALTAYGAIYTTVSSEIKKVIKDIDAIKQTSIASAIVEQITGDVLAPKVGTNDLIKVSSKDPSIQKELVALMKRIGINQLLANITPDLLRYGSYTLATVIDVMPKELKNKKSGKGIIDVTDVVDPGTVIPLTQDGKVEGYVVYDEYMGRIKTAPIADYIHFSLGGERVRVNVKELLPINIMARNTKFANLLKKLPRFVRVGKSILHPVIGEIKELQLLSKLVPATKLNTLSQGNLIGLPLDANYDLKEALEAARRVEGMLNRKVSLDRENGELSVEAILSAAGRTRVIPTFGENGKLEKMDTKSDEPTDLLSSVKEMREVICDLIGVPHELLFKSEGDSKVEIIKRYAKYLRKLKTVQKTLIDGIRQICFIHLSNRNIDFKEEDIEVSFINSLVEIDNLDKLEFADTTVSMMDNMRTFFSELASADSPYRKNVNLNKFLEYMDQNFKTIGLDDIIITTAEGGEEIQLPKDEEPEVDDIDIDLGGEEDSGNDNEDDLGDDNE